MALTHDSLDDMSSFVPANESTTGRYCRLCWNTLDWRRPSGDAQALETGTFVSNYGFGHEEWLLNTEWELDGFRYGFLQPINKAHAALEDRTFSAFLYTRRPDGFRE